MDCRNCLHYEACHRAGAEIPAEICGTFKDRSMYKKVPCKLGDRAWLVKKTRDGSGFAIKRGVISELYYNSDMELTANVHTIGRGRIGKTVFLSREAADKALEERRNCPE